MLSFGIKSTLIKICLINCFEIKTLKNLVQVLKEMKTYVLILAVHCWNEINKILQWAKLHYPCYTSQQLR
jgi:hypothetical protein